MHEIKPETYPDNADDVFNIARGAAFECEDLTFGHRENLSQLEVLITFLEKAIELEEDALVWDLLDTTLGQLRVIMDIDDFDILSKKRRKAAVVQKIPHIISHLKMIYTKRKKLQGDEIKKGRKICTAIAASALFSEIPRRPRIF